MSVSILLAEDHQIVRQGLQALLDAESDFSVVGEVGDGLKAVQQAEILQPDVLVVDLMMPGLNGLDVIRQVSQRLPATRIVVLSMYADESYVVEALTNGASGYVLKGDSVSELVRAVRDVYAGKRFLSAPLSENAIEFYLSRAQQTRQDPYVSLTNREREVFHLAAEGLSNPDIGERLSISPRTVETHRANLMRKLGLQNQTDLIRYALKKGILPMDV